MYDIRFYEEYEKNQLDSSWLLKAIIVKEIKNRYVYCRF